MRTEVSIRSNVVAAQKYFVFGIAFASLMAGASQVGTAQTTSVSTARPDFAPAMIEHAQKMRRYRDPDRGVEHIPRVIDRFSVDRDPKGAIASFQPKVHREQRLLQGHGNQRQKLLHLPSPGECLERGRE